MRRAASSSGAARLRSRARVSRCNTTTASNGLSVKRSVTLVLCATVLVVLAGGASAQQQLRWTSGVAGGGWYAISTGLATLLREKAALDVKVLPGGGAQNPVLVGKGYVEIGLGLPPLLGAAAPGRD